MTLEPPAESLPLPTATASPSLARAAWLVVALLWPVALLNYLDRQMLASMKYSVMSDIPGIGTEANWGLMLGQFKWVYAILSPIGGYVADRFSRRLVICSSLFVWSAITFWTGHVHSYNELLAARSLMGISEAFYIPTGLALIADYHTGATRSRAIGLHQMAIYFGVIAGGFGGYIADSPALGWRFAFTVCGIVGMLYAFPLLVALRNVPAPASHAEEPSGSIDRVSPIRALQLLLSNVNFILLILYFTLPALAGWVVRDWMPAILKQQFQIGQGKAGIAATLYWQSAAILGAVVGGYFADRLVGKTPRGRILISALGMALIAPAIFGVGIAGSLVTAVVFLILFGLGYGIWDGNNMPILCQIVRKDLRATGYGLMNFVSISAGGVADWSFGHLRDHHVPIKTIFALFAAVAALSVVIVLLIRPHPNPPQN